jgi:hypothetical protein
VVDDKEFCYWQDMLTYIANPHDNNFKWQGSGVFNVKTCAWCNKPVKVLKAYKKAIIG